MNLIKEIEIGYFRSIYKINATKLSDMNVIFGRNDSGKSNVLRAMNLFFNNRTNPDTLFDFERDLCHARLAETEASKDARKFISVKVTFNTPSNWRPSLGKEFYVKKSWSVTRQDTPNVATSIKTKRKQIYLTKFLNQVKYHYIPAIKDRRIFGQLLGDVYAVLSQHEEFNSSLTSFSKALKTKTRDLSLGLLDSINVDSHIAPPEDLTELFRALDFETLNSGGDKYSLTLQRGDGVQVRHIPAILAFLSDNSDTDFHIWGFEEPENSLELANAVHEANIFKDYSQSANKQIFLTSHSPAFFSLSGERINRVYIYKEILDRVSKPVSRISHITAQDYPSKMMGETPLLPVVSDYLRDAERKYVKLRKEMDQIEEDTKADKAPRLFVEGESDKNIIEAAVEAYYGADLKIKVVDSKGTRKMEALAADGSTFKELSPARMIFVLVDNDKEGRTLNKDGRLDVGGRWLQHNSNKTYWCRLPFSDEFKKEMAKYKIPKSSWPCVIENCFSREFRDVARGKSKYAVSNICFDEIRQDAAAFRSIAKSNLFNQGQSERMYVFPPEGHIKVEFSQYVAETAKDSPEALEWLKSVLDGIREILDKEESQ